MQNSVIATAALLLSSATPSQTPTDIVQRQDDRWVAALHRGDVASLAAMYEQGAWLVLPGAPPVKGRASIAATLRTFAQMVSNMTLQPTTVVPLGPNAMVENGIARIQIRNEGQVQTSNYQVVWRRTRAGGWKILRDTVSPQ